ncbi:MAG: peptidoglycan-binding protein [Cellulomonas sp.]|nr:peptidoglycan-binding protein [Cellulomonas sp.]
MSTDLAAHTGSQEVMLPRRPRRRRTVTLTVLVVVAAVGAASLGWVAALRFESPAQRAAAATAPAALPVTAAVTQGVLAEQITAIAQVGYANSTAVTVLPASSGTSVVTAQLTAPGSILEAGAPVVAVNGRPVLALPGQFRAYRDLRPGDTGPDVSQLQQGLRATGLAIPAREDGTFGTATAAAVRRLYRGHGFSAPTETTTSATSTTGAPSGGPPTDADATPATAPTLVVPAAELLFVTQLPAVVVGLPAVGALVDAATTVTVASTALVAHAEVATSLLTSLSTDTRGTLSDSSGASVAVQVAALTPGDTTTGAPGSLELTASDGLPQAWVGQPVLATLNLTVVASDALLVPSRAVGVDGAGQAQVTVEQPDGSFRLVPVTELGTLAGQSAITVDDPDALQVGDRVQVG